MNTEEAVTILMQKESHEESSISELAAIDRATIIENDARSNVGPSQSAQSASTPYPIAHAANPSELASYVYSQLGLKTSLSREAIQVALDCIILFDKKQQDYGPRNISVFGEQGVLVRVSDKFERLKNLLAPVSGRKRTPKNEPIMDSWKDIFNYAMIAQMLRRGLWK